jgi:hypothetical protein
MLDDIEDRILAHPDPVALDRARELAKKNTVSYPRIFSKFA